MRKTIPNKLWQSVMKRDKGLCRYCGRKSFSPCLDHVKPVALGGKNSASNLVVACQDCNLTKGAIPGFQLGRRNRLWYRHKIVAEGYLWGEKLWEEVLYVREFNRHATALRWIQEKFVDCAPKAIDYRVDTK